MTKLYFIACIDPIGDNQDLFVEANSADEARSIWIEHYSIDPADLTPDADDYWPDIFAVPALTGSPHNLLWHVDIKLED